MSSPLDSILCAEELLTNFLLNTGTISKEERIQVEKITNSVLLISQNSNVVFLDAFLLELFEDVFQQICAPLIAEVIQDLEKLSGRKEFLLQLVRLFRQLVHFHSSCNDLLTIVGNVIPEKTKAVLENSFDSWFSNKLRSLASSRFEQCLNNFAHASFKSVQGSYSDSGSGKQSFEDFCTLCSYLETLGLSTLILQVLYTVILRELQSLLKIHAEKNFSNRVLPFFNKWLCNDVLTWLRWILGLTTKEDASDFHLSHFSPLPSHQSPLLLERMSPTGKANEVHFASETKPSEDWYLGREKLYTQWYLRLDHLIAQELAKLRIIEMFDIIVDYPDSLAALEDLKECLEKTDQKRVLAKTLKLQLSSRLLHAGVTTSDILATYVHAIHSLRIADPDGNVLSYISKPVRKYLQNRSDTIRCIIHGITNETEDESFRDLISVARNVTEDDEEALDAKWNPLPVDAPYDEYVSEMDDAFGILLSIYGSKESFLNEYRIALAERILKSLDFQLEKEMRNVELLKLRFGESSLLSCDIMLRDIRESRRLLTSAKDEMSLWKNDTFEAVVCSKLIWPKVADESFVPPVEIRSTLEAFQRHFEKIKTPRKLLWDLGSGVMKLSLKTESGQTINVRVSPLQGCVLVLFGRHNRWNFQQLCSELDVDADFLKRKILPLVNQGFLQELDGGIYQFVENLERGFDEEELIIEEESLAEEEHSEHTNSSDIWIYERYIYGILESFQSLPLERIHKLLKVFVINPRYDKTEYELNGLLTNLVQQQKLKNADGLFMLNK